MNLFLQLLIVIGAVLAAGNFYIGVRTMNAAERIAAAQARLNASIKDVAKDIRTLLVVVTTPGGLTEAQSAEVATQMEAAATALEAAAGEFDSSATPDEPEQPAEPVV